MNELPEEWEKAIRNLCEECADVEDFVDTVENIWNEARCTFYKMGHNDGKVAKKKTSDFLLEGYEMGHSTGYESGYKRGHAEGRNQGYKIGYSMGYAEGHKKGYDRGFDQGYKQCFEEYK